MAAQYEAQKDYSQPASDINSKDREIADDLKTRLKGLNTGNPNGEASKYQKLCTEILEFTLSPCFSSLKIEEEVWNEYGTDRVDLIFQNTYLQNRGNSFWRSVFDNYNAESVLVECKNTKDCIGNDEIRQAMSYDRKAAGRLRIILSRRGLDRSGWDIVWDKYQGFFEMLILVLSDDDLIKMVDAKIDGNFPEQVLQDIKGSLINRTFTRI